MPIGKLGQRRQVVIPKEICQELGLEEGDFVEVTSAEGKVIIKPKKLVDGDEVLTPAQKATIDKRLPEGLATSNKDGSMVRLIRSTRCFARSTAHAQQRSLRNPRPVNAPPLYGSLPAKLCKRSPERSANL